MTANTAIQEISIAHSPDSDDAFMFYGLATLYPGRWPYSIGRSAGAPTI